MLSFMTTFWPFWRLTCKCRHQTVIMNYYYKPIANRWAKELMPSKVGGGPAKTLGTAGRFYGNPVSRNQPCKWPTTSTVTLKELQWRHLQYLTQSLLWPDSYEGWEGVGAKLPKQVNIKAVIHKDWQSKQTTNMAFSPLRVSCLPRCQKKKSPNPQWQAFWQVLISTLT